MDEVVEKAALCDVEVHVAALGWVVAVRANVVAAVGVIASLLAAEWDQ